MPSLPYMKWFPADWLKDTRALSASAKGAWIDLCCTMWLSPETPGVLTMRLSAFGRIVGLTEERMGQVIDELTDLRICEREDMADGRIRLSCRRIVRDFGELAKEHETFSSAGKLGAEKRWAKHREANSPPIPEANANPEARSQKPEREKKRAVRADSPPPEFSLAMEEIAKELHQLFPTSSREMTPDDIRELAVVMPVFETFTGEDWHICGRYYRATKRERNGKDVWPRDRAEFVAKPAKAIENIRNWWRKHGREIFEPLIPEQVTNVIKIATTGDDAPATAEDVAAAFSSLPGRRKPTPKESKQA